MYSLHDTVSKMQLRHHWIVKYNLRTVSFKNAIGCVCVFVLILLFLFYKIIITFFLYFSIIFYNFKIFLQIVGTYY